jgi:hypothetical protein
MERGTFGFPTALHRRKMDRMRRWYVRLWLAALVGGVVSGLAFARLELRPWQAWPLGAGVALLVAIATRRRT